MQSFEPQVVHEVHAKYSAENIQHLHKNCWDGKESVTYKLFFT